jgi:hypothetical protein
MYSYIFYEQEEHSHLFGFLSNYPTSPYNKILLASFENSNIKAKLQNKFKSYYFCEKRTFAIKYILHYKSLKTGET